MRSEYILLLVGMTLVTYLPRVIPLVILSRIDLPTPIVRWLKYIPTAILSALLAPGILMTGGALDLSTANPRLLAAIPTFLVAAARKDIFLTVITGVISFVLLGLIGGL
ncbi:MAG: AzlD domain-containing protein [Firmicutes bacterium]|nr:AzlD domain-containing protein [Bacillota bacterium]